MSVKQGRRSKPRAHASRNDVEKPYPHLLIRASAGTGKTFQLSNRFLRLLRDDVPPDHILAVTFTRKAAGEILDRVIQRLTEAVDDEAKRAELAAFTESGPMDRDECLRLVENAMRNLHRLRVGTLDSFYAQIARSVALELGLPPAWQIIDELEDDRLRNQSIEAVLAADDVTAVRTLLNLLFKGQATRGVSRMVRDDVDSLYDIFLDATPEAWRTVPRYKALNDIELAATIEDLREAPLEGRQAKARDADYDLAIAGDWRTMLCKGLTAKVLCGEAKYYGKEIPAAAVAIYERLIEHAKAELINLIALQTESTYELLARFHAEYRGRKRQRQRLRFEDVTHELAGHRETSDWRRLALRLDSRVEHLLLDEFQDTSAAQWRVLLPLARRVTTTLGGSFFCVGDVKQAIYGWRGGVAEIFDAIDRQLGGLESRSLNASYRSAPPIIETVNRVFAGAAEHPNLGGSERGVQKWCRQFSQHVTTRNELSGYAELRTCPAANRDNGDDQHEVRLAYAADVVRDLAAEMPDREIGVLVRSNDVLRKLIFELRHRGVDASEEGGNPLTDSAAVGLVMSLLQIADHPGDTVAWHHLACSPIGQHFGICETRDPQTARKLAAGIRRDLSERGYGEVVQGWVEPLAPHCDRRELRRLQQLVELAYAYTPQSTLRPIDFIAFVQRTRVSDPTAAKVRVMTIHQAKGLEFDVVVLPELDKSLRGGTPSFVCRRPDVAEPADRVCRHAASEIRELMPADLQQMFEKNSEDETSEAMCVLYVAMTRAIHALHAIINPQATNSFHQTAVGILRASLAPNVAPDPQQTLFEIGDRDWHRQMKRTETSPAGSVDEVAKAAVQPVVVRLATHDGLRRRGLERKSPSGLEGDVLVDVTRMFQPGQSIALHRGSLIHAWMEQIQWLEDGAPSNRRLLEVAADVIAAESASELQVEPLIAEFAQMIDRPAIRALLSRTRYADAAAIGLPVTLAKQLSSQPAELIVQNERGFAIRDGEHLLSGFIDRLVLLQQDGRIAAAEILDFKTDELDATNADAVKEKVAYYAPQLQAYRRAVARLTHLPLDSVVAHLAFVGPGLVHKV